MKVLSELTQGLLALWMLPGMGPVRIHTLWKKFGSIEAIFNTNPKNLADLLGVNVSVTNPIPKALERDEFKNELKLIENHQIDVVDFTSSSYPCLLKEIHNAPPVLYIKGNSDLESGFLLAFVGSRKASFAGQNMCRKLIKKISVLKSDTVIVSGLALGVDTTAHTAALESGLKTIAVLANGLSDIYPARNKNLAEKITNSGSVISEFPMGTKPVAGNFPLRNRIISGLAKGVIVIEAGERSGATITAGYAIEQNRELFALPGPADSSFYRGTNRLIQRSQAKLVMDAEDILEEFYSLDRQLSFDEKNENSKSRPDNITGAENKILQLINDGINQKDRLLEHSDLPIQQLLSIITSLELKGLIVSKPGAVFEIVHS